MIHLPLLSEIVTSVFGSAVWLHGWAAASVSLSYFNCIERQATCELYEIAGELSSMFVNGTGINI